MQNSYIFSGPLKRVTGIDENGYGPLIGPLVITGVQILTPFDSIYSTSRDILSFNRFIRDSKKIFKRSKKSYALGESIALSLLSTSDKSCNYFHSLIRDSGNYSSDDIPNFKLPVWTDKKEQVFFSKNSPIKVLNVFTLIIDAQNFNKLIKRYGNKAFIDFWGFKQVREQLPSDIYMMGKIGGTKFYKTFFNVANEYPQAIVEEKDISLYTMDEKELYFILNGDEKYFPIMLSGIIGKYIRELFMKSISEKFGFKSDIPFASGYRHDPKTAVLLEQILKSGLIERFVRIR